MENTLPADAEIAVQLEFSGNNVEIQIQPNEYVLSFNAQMVFARKDFEVRVTEWLSRFRDLLVSAGPNESDNVGRAAEFFNSCIDAVIKKSGESNYEYDLRSDCCSVRMRVYPKS